MSRDEIGRQLVQRCLSGCKEARAEFESLYLDLIVQFPSRARGRDTNVEPAEFYLFLFEGDRLYRRLGSFHGGIALRSFLEHYVLPTMLSQCERALKRIREYSVEDMDTFSLGQSINAVVTRGPEDDGIQNEVEETLCGLAPNKRLLVKLMLIEDFELDPDEYVYLIDRTGRTLVEIARQVEETRESIRLREATCCEKYQESARAFSALIDYECERIKIERELESVQHDSFEESINWEKLKNLDKKTEKRRTQQRRALHEAARTKITARIRDVSGLLQEPEQNIRARWSRLRRDLRSDLGKKISRNN